MTARGRPYHAPGSVPVVICAVSQIRNEDLPVPSRPANRPMDAAVAGVCPRPDDGLGLDRGRGGEHEPAGGQFGLGVQVLQLHPAALLASLTALCHPFVMCMTARRSSWLFHGAAAGSRSATAS